VSGSIGRRELVEDTRVTLGGIAVAVDEGRATLGYLHPRAEAVEGGARAAGGAPGAAQRGGRRAAAARAPRVHEAAAVRDGHRGRRRPRAARPATHLARAYEALEELGGRILLGDGGTLRSTLPAQFDPRPNANARCSATTL
jgi:hypothetical protein